MRFPLFLRHMLQGNIAAIGGNILLIGAMLFCYIQQPRFLELLDNKIYDMLLPFQVRQTPSPVPVIIDIDEESIERYGQWPWPRYLIADLLQKLHQYGTSATALDILFAEPDRSSPNRMQQDLARDHDLAINFTGLPDNMRNYDKQLADTLRSQPVVLGMFGRFNEPNAPRIALPPPVGSLIKKQGAAPPIVDVITKADTATLPLMAFWHAAPIGTINMSPDTDGLIREIPLIMSIQGSVYASLSLRTLMVALKIKNLSISTSAEGILSIQVGPYTIPVSPGGNLFVPYQGPGKTYRYIKAKDVLTSALPPNDLKGTITLVGTSAPGLIDLRSTPFDRVYPGVEVHATVLDAILSNHYIRMPAWSPGLQVLGICFFGIVAGALFTQATPVVYILIGILLSAGISFGSYLCFIKGYYISPLYFLLTVALQGIVLLSLRFWHEEYQKIVLRKTFSRYVSPEVVKKITRLQDDVYSGEECCVTIMFTDIRKFTHIAKNLEAPQVVSLLNRYFTPMTALVRSHSGTLDKFIGDALMAFWNAPVPVPNHPQLAVTTALAMLNTLQDLNKTLQQEFSVQIQMGIGLHTGNAYVGNMGSKDLINYTIVGDNVNIAARLEALCTLYGVPIVLSEETREACSTELIFIPLDTLVLENREQPIALYTVMEPTAWEARAHEFASYTTAHQAYRQGNFAKSHAQFNKLCITYPEQQLYHLFAERTQKLAKAPPQQWEGLWHVGKKQMG